MRMTRWPCRLCRLSRTGTELRADECTTSTTTSHRFNSFFVAACPRSHLLSSFFFSGFHGPHTAHDHGARAGCAVSHEQVRNSERMNVPQVQPPATASTLFLWPRARVHPSFLPSLASDPTPRMTTGHLATTFNAVARAFFHALLERTSHAAALLLA